MIKYLKSAGMLLLSIVQRDVAKGIQKSYYISQLLKGLQSCDLLKLDVETKSEILSSGLRFVE